MKSTWILGVACAALLIQTTTARATLLAPASSIGLPSENEPVGATLLTSSTVNFTSLTFSGTLISQVWANDSSNPFSGLTFTYQLSNSSFSADPIDRFTLSSYAGFSVDASYFGAGIVPTSVARNPAGNQISFNFSGPFQGTLVQGATSPLLILQTSSLVWQVSNAAVINSSSVNVSTFAPSAVPEPTVVALLATGALALAWRRRV